MPVIEAKVKRWGNSLGFIIPSEVVEQEHLRENDTVSMLLLRDSKKAFRETFGMLKGKLKKPTQRIMDEIDRELYD